jgi:hypothetical protein
VKFARTNNLLVAVKSGGHNVAGGHVRFRHIDRARPEVRSMPNLIIVSFIHGGLTALRRSFRAARARRPSQSLQGQH